MHHVALNRARSHNSNLNHQIVITARPQARQHTHLGTGLDLEHTQRVASSHHLIYRRVLGRNLLHGECFLAITADQIEALLDRGQHAQRQHVDLQQAECFQIVLLPLDHRAFRHTGVLDRYEMGERTLTDDEAANVLRQVAGKPDQCLRQRHQHLDAGIVIIYLGIGKLFPQVRTPPVDGFGDVIEQLVIEPQCLAHITQCAARAIGNHRRRQRRTTAAVLAVDILNDLFAAGVLEIHIDVRRLVTLPGNETLEQHLDTRGIDLGNTEAIAHRRVGRRTAALTEDMLTAGKGHQVMHGEKIMFVAEFPDQLQFVLDNVAHLRCRPLGPTPPDAHLGQLPQPTVRGIAFRYQLARVLVAQFVETEVAAPGHRQCRLQ